MRTVNRKKLCRIVAVAGVLLAALAVFTVWQTFRRYVLVNWELYPRAGILDLQGQLLAPGDFEKLQKKLPDSDILWDVPFQGSSVPSNVQQLEVTALTEQDVQMLAFLNELQVLDGRNCTDIQLLAQARRMYPDVQIMYTVSVGGGDYPQDARTVELYGLTEEDIWKLECLQELVQVTVFECSDRELLQQLKIQYPQWNLDWWITLGEENFHYDAQRVTAHAATQEQLESAMLGFTALESLTLVNPKAGGDYLVGLRERYPDMEIRWELDFQGVIYSDDMTEVDISHAAIESTEQAENIGSYFPNLEKLIVDSGSIDNDTMAEFRERMRTGYKVVWTVVCGTGKYGSFEVRTDETTFMPLKHGIYYFHDDDMYNVRYCEDMVCMDVGHMTFTDVSFVEYMPHLKYLILNFTSVKDITPLSSCKELVFLELDHSWVTDYSPLLGCTALEDLNLGDTYGDPEPISQMTWLKNLWWVSRSMSVKAYLEQTLTDTYILFQPDSKQTTSFGWRKLPNYYAMRDMLKMPYME